MLYSHGWRSGLSPLVDVHWPVLSVCPQVTPLLYQQDLLHTDLQQLRSRLELMELMEPLQQQTLEQTAPFQTSVALRPLSYQLTTDGQRFSLNLDTGGFSPEELSVRQVGRKLRVSRKTEKKQEDATGCSSYRLQEFRQELDLPEGVKPETLTCYLGPDGKLHIQADKAPSVEETERELPINRSSEEKTQTEGGSSTDNKQQNCQDENNDYK
uniref:SHSP domain-containing protein n=1 Tax=Sphaeramia orbicularis TaxID=375764 RepID=A0A673B736_9TELE